MHNMTRHLSSVLLFFLLLGYTCGTAYADNTAQPNTVELFVPDKITMPKKIGDEDMKVKAFESPFLVGADGVMVAFADVFYTDRDVQKVNIAERYIETVAEGWVEKVTENNGDNWKTELVIQGDDQNDDFAYVRNSMAVVKGNKIYLLAMKSNKTKESSQIYNALNSDFVLLVGDVTDNTEKGTGKTVKWQTSVLPLSTLNEQLKQQSLSVSSLGDSYSAFLTEDGNIVFIVGILKGSKIVPAIIHSNGTGKETELELSYVWTAENCYFPSFFNWEGKIFMVTKCPDGGHKLRESTDMGKTWRDAEGPISRLWDNLLGAKDITTVTIENKTVLLFTQRRNKVSGTQGMFDIYLLMTDGSRVHQVGSIVSDVGYVSSIRFLYTNDELFSLYKHWNAGQGGNIILTRLKDQLKYIKSVLKAWAGRDEYLSKPCNETTPQGTLSESPCATPMPTDGLVGFLSNTTSGDDDNIWVDEYFYVNATVKGGTKVDNGFTFSGTNAGAQWPIGSQGQSQLYDFSRNGMAVVATMTIHNVPKSDSPLLTIDRIPSNKPLGLWYGSNKKWKVKSVDSDGAPGSSWDTNNTYRVALILRNNNVSAYIDGEPLGDPLQISSPEEDLLGIGYIFIGGHKEDSEENENTEGTVTVTNVLLYNRPLNTSELKALGRKRAETIESKGHAGETIGSKGHAGDTTESKGHTGQSPEGGKDLQQFLKPTNSQDSCVYMPVVTSLLCLLGLWGLTVFC